MTIDTVFPLLFRHPYITQHFKMFFVTCNNPQLNQKSINPHINLIFNKMLLEGDG